MRVLILEDERLLAALLKREVEQAGHVVLGPVSTSDQAFELAAADPPDMALLNVDLCHGLNGGAVAEMLTEEWDTPCLFVSGTRAMAEHYRHFAVGFLAKPWGADTIAHALSVVQSIIEGSPVGRVPLEMTLFIEPLAEGRQL